MTLEIALLMAIAAIAACSASPSDGGQSVPRNSPLEPNIVNMPATTGRANLTPTAPPFAIAEIGNFDEPFAMAFLPDGRLLVTEKAGRLKLRGTDGAVADIAGVPPVAKGGQGGLLDVAIAPDFAASKNDLSDLFGAGRGGQRAGADARDARRTARKPADQDRGDLALGIERARRAIRREHPVLARRPISVPELGRAPALHPGAGPQTGARQDPAADARRQGRAGQPDVRARAGSRR